MNGGGNGRSGREKLDKEREAKGKQPKRWRREKRMKKNIENELVKMKKEWGVGGGGRNEGKQMKRE